jgi:hypothetical protein
MQAGARNQKQILQRGLIALKRDNYKLAPELKQKDSKKPGLRTNILVPYRIEFVAGLDDQKLIYRNVNNLSIRKKA